MVQLLEIAVVKLTEYEIVHFLCYDETYAQLCSRLDLSKATGPKRFLEQMVHSERIGQQGVQLHKFTISLANLERDRDFVQTASKLYQKVLASKG